MESWRRVETWLAGFACAVLTSPGVLLLGVSEDPRAPDNPALRFLWLPVYAVALLLVATNARRLARFWAAGLACLVLVGWAYASKSWSIDPEVTGRRVVALALTTLFGLGIGSFEGPRFVRMLAATFMVLAVGDILTVVLTPQFGITHDSLNGGDWRGLYSDKNALALYGAVGALAALSAALADPARRRRWLVAFALSAAMLLLSRGKTSLLALLLGCVVVAALALVRRGAVPAVLTLWAGGVAVAVLGFVATAAPTAVLKALGKDPSLTGRTDIWASLLRQMEQAPWTGFGFAAFWGKESTPANFVRRETGWSVPSAHNGWLDLLVQVGAVGVILFALVFLVALVCAVVRIYRRRDGYFTLVYLLVFGLLSASESVLEMHNSLTWALFIAVLARATGPAGDAAAAPRSLQPLPPVGAAALA